MECKTLATWRVALEALLNVYWDALPKLHCWLDLRQSAYFCQLQSIIRRHSHGVAFHDRSMSAQFRDGNAAITFL